MKIEKNKIYKLKNGLIARIYATDGPAHCPVHGAVPFDGEWTPHIWRADGSSASAASDTGYSIVGPHVGIAEPEPIIINAAAMPAWCNRAAMDANGVWYAYSAEPTRSTQAWLPYNSNDSNETIEAVYIPKQYAPKWTGDWTKSCVKFR